MEERILNELSEAKSAIEFLQSKRTLDKADREELIYLLKILSGRIAFLARNRTNFTKKAKGG